MKILSITHYNYASIVEKSYKSFLTIEENWAGTPYTNPEIILVPSQTLLISLNYTLK